MSELWWVMSLPTIVIPQRLGEQVLLFDSRHLVGSLDVAGCDERGAPASEGRTVTNKTATCPVCGGSCIPFVYGLPGWEVGESAERGEVVIGGCVISDKNPDFRCSQCGHEWLADASGAPRS